MDVKAVKRLLQIDHDYASKSITLHLFQCDWLEGTPRALGCDEIRWVKPEELADFQLPPPDLQVLPFIQNLVRDPREKS